MSATGPLARGVVGGVDPTIRELMRRAQAGGEAERQALERALGRLGRNALWYTGPDRPPAQPQRGARQVDRARTTELAYRSHGWTPATRRQAAARACDKRHARRAGRRARKLQARDWDLWE